MTGECELVKENQRLRKQVDSLQKTVRNFRKTLLSRKPYCLIKEDAEKMVKCLDIIHKKACSLSPFAEDGYRNYVIGQGTIHEIGEILDWFKEK